MSGARSRRKGHNYERKIAKEFREMGYERCKTARNESHTLDAAGVDLTNTEPFNIQCKAIESGVNYRNLLYEMPQDGINLIFHKKKRKEFVIMTKESFYELLEKYINGANKTNRKT